VGKGYLYFSVLSNISAISLTCMGFLSTQALFVALGTSTTKAALASAAFTWVLKDGIGQFGGILFASRYGSNFDEDIKKWRFQSWTFYALSIHVEILTLKFPGCFLALAAFANIRKFISLKSKTSRSCSLQPAEPRLMSGSPRGAISAISLAKL